MHLACRQTLNMYRPDMKHTSPIVTIQRLGPCLLDSAIHRWTKGCGAWQRGHGAARSGGVKNLIRWKSKRTCHPRGDDLQESATMRSCQLPSTSFARSLV